MSQGGFIDYCDWELDQQYSKQDLSMIRDIYLSQSKTISCSQKVNPKTPERKNLQLQMKELVVQIDFGE